MNESFHTTVSSPPPDGWESGYVTIEIERPDPRRLAVEAWRRGAFAIHERTYAEGEREAILTHAPTGLRINSFPSLDETKKFAEIIEPFTDWSAISKKFKPGSDLYFKVRDVAEAIKYPALSSGQRT